MKLLELLKGEIQEERGTILAMTALSGIANAAILAIINEAAKVASVEVLNSRLLVLFALALAIYIYGFRFILGRASRVFEKMVFVLRLRLLEKVADAELGAIREVGSSKIQNRVSQEAAVLSQFSGHIVASLQASVMIVFCFAYIAWLSIPAFLLAALLLAGGVVVYMSNAQQIGQYMHRTSQKEVDLISKSTQLVQGFKELKLNPKKRAAFVAATVKLCDEVRALKVDTADLFDRNYIFSQTFFYLLMASIVFVLPRLVPTYTSVLTEVTATILFITGAVGTVVNAVPVIGKANLAAQHMFELEAELDRRLGDGSQGRQGPRPPSPFTTIKLDGIVYTYPGPEGFVLGPISVTITAGTVTYVIGGNGSGKSTLIEAITGLMPPTSGRIEVDGVPIDDANRAAYRENFTLIGSDYFLFDQLYGVEEIDEQFVAGLLTSLKLAEKTKLVGRAFSTLDLSSGQRKRLALVVARLENKPIYVFDEWTSDQDPEYRQHFYTRILPELKAAGHTVIVVTHDDRYHDTADRIIELERGKVRRDYVVHEATA